MMTYQQRLVKDRYARAALEAGGQYLVRDAWRLMYSDVVLGGMGEDELVEFAVRLRDSRGSQARQIA